MNLLTICLFSYCVVPDENFFSYSNGTITLLYSFGNIGKSRDRFKIKIKDVIFFFSSDANLSMDVDHDASVGAMQL